MGQRFDPFAAHKQRASVVKLVYTLDLGSSASVWGFESLRSHTKKICGGSVVVTHHLAKVGHAGPIPVRRFGAGFKSALFLCEIWLWRGNGIVIQTSCFAFFECRQRFQWNTAKRKKSGIFIKPDSFLWRLGTGIESPLVVNSAANCWVWFGNPDGPVLLFLS